MRALIISLNPAIDAEWRVDDVLWEERNSILSERRWAGGKGINVARWLKHLGGKPRLLLPLGGETGREISKRLRTEELPASVIRIRESTRVNVVVTSARGGQIRFNPLGPKLSRTEWRAVLENVQRELKSLGTGHGRARHSVRAGAQHTFSGVYGVTRPTPLLILSGSLPRGVPISAYARLIRIARRFGVRTLLDCDGPALAAAVKARPFFVKPNEHELSQWRGKLLPTEREVVSAARDLSRVTGGWVLVSRGARRSLLLNVSESFQRFAKPRRVRVQNTVGAGDALLAAAACGIEKRSQPINWLQFGLSAGSAATQCIAGKTISVGFLKETMP